MPNSMLFSNFNFYLTRYLILVKRSASSRFPSSLYSLMRNSNEIAIGNVRSTLNFVSRRWHTKITAGILRTCDWSTNFYLLTWSRCWCLANMLKAQEYWLSKVSIFNGQTHHLYLKRFNLTFRCQHKSPASM